LGDWIYWATDGNNYKKILSSSMVVKRKIAFGNSFGSQSKIDGLRLKCCILRDDPKNNITGSAPHSSYRAMINTARFSQIIA
jgi:hypothetical protein